MSDAAGDSVEGRFLVRVADNYQYMDESAWYEYGRFATLDEAIEASCAVVTHWLRAGYQPGMTGEQLFKAYVMFGDDPFITDTCPEDETDEAANADADAAAQASEPPLPDVMRFSAWDFAKQMAPIVVAMKSAAISSR